jgi:hypothetical protein
MAPPFLRSRLIYGKSDAAPGDASEGGILSFRAAPS